MIKFQKQENQPLFSEILWSRPQNTRSAKSLLIVGGHKQSFKHTQDLFMQSNAAGIGNAKLALPDSLKEKINIEHGILYLPSNRSGSISLKAGATLTNVGKNFDGILISSDLSDHPEISKLVSKMVGAFKTTFIFDGAAVFYVNDNVLVGLKEKLLVLKYIDAQKFAAIAEVDSWNTEKNGLVAQIENISALAKHLSSNLVVTTGSNNIVCVQNKISVTSSNLGAGEISATLATFLLQHADKYRALTSACWWARWESNPQGA